jgi:hypothetical protein
VSWPALLTPNQAALYLSIGESSLLRLKQAGILKTVAIKLPGSSKPVVRYRLTDLDEYVSGLKYGEGEFLKRELGV